MADGEDWLVVAQGAVVIGSSSFERAHAGSGDLHYELLLRARR